MTLSENERVIIDYSDNAGGIQESVRDKIFDPFFTTKDSGVGTGLGLSIVHGIIQQHRGRVEMNTEWGKGTTFRLIIPRSLRPVTLPVEQTKDAHQPIDQAPKQKPTVLIIDDELVVCELLQNMIEKYFDVTFIQTPDNAVEAFKEGHYDLVLTDLRMPKVSGLEVIERIRAVDSETPILLMSGHAEIEAEVRVAFEKGAVGLITKPFLGQNDVLRELMKYIGEPFSALTSVRQVDGLVTSSTQ